MRRARFDVIVSDIALSRWHGLRTDERSWPRWSEGGGHCHLRLSDPEDVHERRVTGFDYHLCKPIDADQLHDLLEKLERNKAPETSPVVRP